MIVLYGAFDVVDVDGNVIIHAINMELWKNDAAYLKWKIQIIVDASFVLVTILDMNPYNSNNTTKLFHGLLFLLVLQENLLLTEVI